MALAVNSSAASSWAAHAAQAGLRDSRQRLFTDAGRRAEETSTSAGQAAAPDLRRPTTGLRPGHRLDVTT